MPRDGTRTRTLLLDTAERLVKRDGFAATSVDLILEESGSSKGAFFHHFPSKLALAEALVKRYVEGDLAMLQEGLDVAAAADGATARVLAFLGHYEAWAETLVAEDTHCLYLAMLTEQGLPPEAAGQIDRAITAWREGFGALLAAAYAERGVRGGPDIDALADHLFATFEGAFLMCRSAGSAEPMRSQLRVFRMLVHSLLGSDDAVRAV